MKIALISHEDILLPSFKCTPTNIAELVTF
jgi:hypothetical protein